MTCEDKLGQVISSGSYIAYGHNLGRCAGIRLGRVVRTPVRVKSLTYGGFNWRITIQGIDDDWKGNKPKLLSKLSTLQFPERIIVVDPALFPTSYLDLLKNTEIE